MTNLRRAVWVTALGQLLQEFHKKQTALQAAVTIFQVQYRSRTSSYTHAVHLRGAREYLRASTVSHAGVSIISREGKELTRADVRVMRTCKTTNVLSAK